jgi:hypothetical protein
MYGCLARTEEKRGGFSRGDWPTSSARDGAALAAAPISLMLHLRIPIGFLALLLGLSTASVIGIDLGSNTYKIVVVKPGGTNVYSSPG